MNKYTYMIDIETTGTDKETDDVLEIAIIPVAFDGFWKPSEVMAPFHRKVYSARQPANAFAKKFMAKLYAECNALNPERDDIGSVSEHLRHWLHGEEDYAKKHQTPKYFMGWNASNFDLEFLFKKGVMTASYYVPEGDKEVLCGDAHYRVYEQTGALELMSNVTGLSRKLVQDLAGAMVPKEVKLPTAGLTHNALDDCYYQINMMNGLIALGKSGFRI